MRWTALLCGVMLGSCACASVRAEDAATPWSAGIARADITPDGPVWMAGYAARKTPSEGVEHRLSAKALALRDASGTTILWLTADVIGFDRAFTDRVTERVCDEQKLPREAVALFASHTHTGPTLKVSEESFRAQGTDSDSPAARNNLAFRRGLENTLVRLAGEALSSLKPVRVSFGVGQSGFAMNRREKTATGYKIGVNPHGPTDRSVPVLRIASSDNRLVGIVFGYACHNTTLTDKSMRLSGDYAGFAQTHLEDDHPGAVALFVKGCAGDANPEPRGTPELARAHGRSMADAVEAVLRMPQIELTGALGSAMAEPMIRFAGPTDRDSYERRLSEPGSGRQAHARKILALLDAGKPIETEHSYPIQAFRLGDQLTLLALAGEVVADYALTLQKELASDSQRLWVAAYANDVFGYVGSRRVIQEGGYEGLDAYYYSSYPAPLDEGTEELIIKAAKDVVQKTRESRGHD